MKQEAWTPARRKAQAEIMRQWHASKKNGNGSDQRSSQTQTPAAEPSQRDVIALKMAGTMEALIRVGGLTPDAVKVIKPLVDSYFSTFSVVGHKAS